MQFSQFHFSAWITNGITEPKKTVVKSLTTDFNYITAKKTDNEKIKSAAKIYFSTIAN